MSSNVYFTDFRSKRGESMLAKLKRLIIAAGIGNIDFKNKFVAIKVHFGEPGNMAFIRPNYAKVIADYVKSKGGKPFLTDCNTLYVGRRGDALNHLDAAYENGWSPFSTGCHVIIADGLKGSDETLIPVQGGEYVSTAKIGKAIADADIIISLSHFKGHENAGFGGAIKNLGMGSGSRAGKMEQHCDAKVAVKTERCVGCGKCTLQCAQDAIKVIEGKAQINADKCVGCGRCLSECNLHAIYCPTYSSVKLFNCKMAEYTKAVIQDKPTFHVNLVMDVSPVCDCRSCNDVPIIADVGMFASYDPLALDQACMDACNAATPLPNSQLAEQLAKHEDRHDHFLNLNCNGHLYCLEHCEKIGVGTRQYQLITMV